jgi:signal transduction histidine kinase
METSGPGIARDAVGPLRRVLLGPDARLPAPRSRRLRAYGVPVGLFALIGLGLANMAYLEDNRGLASVWSVLLSAGAMVPVAVAVRRPLVAWRLAYPLLYLGTVHAKPSESWPWSPVQIVAFLVVLALVAVAEDGAVSFWVAARSVVPPFVYADRANAFGVAVLFAAIAMAGDLVARRRRTRAQLAEQAELTELERARRAVLEERARIAREMHDVVAHHMSMIAVRAETAPFRVGELPGPARAEFAGIASSARSALADMRRLLGVLRADTEAAAREPQPGLAELPDLVAAARRAGVPVTWSADGDGAVPEPAGLAAYRIVQEALANAARHAPGAAVDAAVRTLPDRLEIRVRNAPPATGPATAPAAAGHGLTGMRERAELLGGTLSAGPDPDGGYAVTATLPYGGEPS